MKTLQNMSGVDRLARLLAGIALPVAGSFAALPVGWKIAAIAAGVVLVATALSGICPGYVPFGIDTRRRRIGAQ